ncbi:MAG: DMT family transporter [Candidatus Atribacteria bacterium]|nr:DMT family transporter [Candidatus Atribacteria bacterium]
MKEGHPNLLTIKSDISLLLANLIWGVTFVTMKNLLENVPPLTILFWRFAIAATLLLLISLFSKWQKINWAGGIFLGISLFAGYLFQTWGLIYTTPARSAFITGLSVILVPPLAFLLLRSSIDRFSIIGTIVSLLGLLFLTWQKGETKSLFLLGDFLTLLGAIAYALQIVLVEKFTKDNESLPLATIEMGTVALLSLVFGILFHQNMYPYFSVREWEDILFLGIFATALAFTLQKKAQKHTSAIHAGLIFASEPVFAAIFSYFFWQEKFTPRTLAGCVLILGGILFSQLGLLFNPSIPHPQSSGQIPILPHKEDL